MKVPTRYALATDKVRFVGDPIACVVAETVHQGKDAAEAIEVEIDPLPAVTTPREAVKAGAPQLYDDVPGNVACDWHFGDTAKVEQAFKEAAHVVKMPLRNTRLVVNAMEPRGFVASYDKASGRFTVYTGGQSAFGQKMATAEVLKVTPDKVHALLGNVGGSFGMKAPVFPEYVCVLHAARELGRPVKWIDERSSSFLSDTHGRDHDQTIELALDKDGKFLAVRTTGYGNSGAFVSMMGTMQPTITTMKNTIGVYKTPLIEQSTKLVFTNTTPVAPYRGAGRPEGNYYMERLIDQAAREMGIDRIELRKRNHIKPKEMPYKTPSDNVYDSGDFPALLKRVLELADYKGFAKRKRESKKRGKLRGIGVGSFLEVTAPQAKELGGIRFEADGTVTIITGTLDFGQGHCDAVCASARDQARRAVRQDPPAAGRQRPASARRRHRRLEVGDDERHRDRARRREGDRARQADRGIRARSRNRRYRVHNGRFVIAGTDRTLGDHGARRQAAQRPEAAGRYSTNAQRHARERRRAGHLSQRCARGRSRDRSRHRHRRGREICRGQRLRHRAQPAAGARPGARRPGAGHRARR